MDHERFAALTKALATGSRRSAIRGATAAAIGGLLALAGRGAPEAEAAFCRFPGQECGSARQCCANKCNNGVCGCKPRGATCYANFGLSCCSKKCRKGVCR